MFRLPPPSMEEHPILGVVLFLTGSVLVGLAYYGANAPLPDLFTFFEGIHSDAMSSLVLGHIFAFNGVLWFVLGCRKMNRTRRSNG